MASFTAVDQSTEIGPFLKDGTNFDVALSGTYNMTIDLEREIGSKGSGTWERVKRYTTANATVAERYSSKGPNARYRLYVKVDTSGTCTATLTEEVNKEDVTIKDEDGVARVRVFSGTTPGVYVSTPPVNVTAATESLTAEEHAGKVVTVNAAAGCTLTLPDATGTGDVYKYFCGTTVTSNNNIIQVSRAADTMSGVCLMAQDSANEVNAFETAGTSDTITMNGSTKGGILGDFIELVDVAANKWYVKAVLSGTGTEATPFSAAVS